MAGDWIKMRVGLDVDPDIIAIAAQTDMDEDAVVGKLYRLWAWADQHTVDGNAAGVTEKWLDRYLGVAGFASALASVNWLQIHEWGLQIPNFERHNGQSAKQRALTAQRVARHKRKSNAQGNGPGNARGNGPGVTDALPREEKRRVTTTTPPTPPLAGGAQPQAAGRLAVDQETKPKPKKQLPAEAMELAEYLRDQVQAQRRIKVSGAKLRAWAEHIRKAAELDGLDYDRQRTAMQWHFENLDRMACHEIQSGRSWREKAPRVEAAMERVAREPEPEPVYQRGTKEEEDEARVPNEPEETMPPMALYDHQQFMKHDEDYRRIYLQRYPAKAKEYAQ